MEIEIGRITHYYSKIGVAMIELTAESLKIGDTIRVMGHTTDFTQTVDSMEFEHQALTEVKPGQTFGVKVSAPVRDNDKVSKITP